MHTLFSFSSAQESAQALAKAIANDIHTLLRQQTHLHLALSGGKSPILFFQTLNQYALDWSRVHISLVDERLVPTQHPDSNTRLLRQHFFQNRAKDASFIPLINDNCDESCLNNTQKIQQFAQQHFCLPDIVVLGMGEDGHTASLFPNLPELFETQHHLVITAPQNALHRRISMTFPAIQHAKKIYLAILGSKKYAVYQNALLHTTPQLPISFLLNHHQTHLMVFHHP